MQQGVARKVHVRFPAAQPSRVARETLPNLVSQTFHTKQQQSPTMTNETDTHDLKALELEHLRAIEAQLDEIARDIAEMKAETLRFLAAPDQAAQFPSAPTRPERPPRPGPNPPPRLACRVPTQCHAGGRSRDRPRHRRYNLGRTRSTARATRTSPACM